MRNCELKPNIGKRLRRKYFLFTSCAVVAILAVILIITSSLKTDTVVAEWWTVNISQPLVTVFGAVTSVVPLSTFECFIIAAVIFIIVGAVRWVRLLASKHFYKAVASLLCVAIAALSLACVYDFMAGFSYYRAAVDIPAAGAEYDGKQTAEAARYFFEDFNYLSEKLERDESGAVICPYKFDELSELLRKEYARLGDYYFASTPKCKRFVFSKALSCFWLAGITFLPLGEANVNGDMPSSSVPQTMAHELAHAKGVMREADANLVSYYILLSSENEYLRYCGYYSCIDKLLTAVSISNISDREVFSEIAALRPEAVSKEWALEREYWRSFPDVTERISDFINSIYLNLNGAGGKGTGSYDDEWTVTPIEKPDPVGGDDAPPIIEYKPSYSDVHKMFFAIYENFSDQTRVGTARLG